MSDQDNEKKQDGATVIEGQVIPTTDSPADKDQTQDGSNHGNQAQGGGDQNDRTQKDDAYAAGERAAASTKAFLTETGHALKDAAHNLDQDIRKADAEGRFDKAKDIAGKAGSTVSGAYRKIVPQDARKDIADGTKKAGKAMKGFFKGLLG